MFSYMMSSIKSLFINDYMDLFIKRRYTYKDSVSEKILPCIMITVMVFIVSNLLGVVLYFNKEYMLMAELEPWMLYFFKFFPIFVVLLSCTFLYILYIFVENKSISKAAIRRLLYLTVFSYITLMPATITLELTANSTMCAVISVCLMLMFVPFSDEKAALFFYIYEIVAVILAIKLTYRTHADTGRYFLFLFFITALSYLFRRIYIFCSMRNYAFRMNAEKACYDNNTLLPIIKMYTSAIFSLDLTTRAAVFNPEVVEIIDLESHVIDDIYNMSHIVHDDDLDNFTDMLDAIFNMKLNAVGRKVFRIRSKGGGFSRFEYNVQYVYNETVPERAVGYLKELD